MAHRDLKLDNIIIDKANQGAIKLVDFSSAQTYYPGGRKMRLKGRVVEFRSPEMTLGKYNELTDVWSIGVILYNMLAGTAPFKG